MASPVSGSSIGASQLQELFGGASEGSSSTTPGDVEGLRKILAQMNESMTPEGMDALFKSIFQQGFEKNMPTLLNNANTTGIRPQDATTQTLQTNDLIARLTGQAAGAVLQQQANAGTVAANIAANTKSSHSKNETKNTFDGMLSSFGLK